MYCNNCGNEVREGYFCDKCGARLLTYDNYMKATQNAPVRQPLQPGTNSSATAAFVLSIISLVAWLLPIFGYPISIIGLILGILAAKRQQKFAVPCIIMSSVGLLATLINSILGVLMFLSSI